MSIVAHTAVSAAAEQPHKKLIEFGWDEPDTAFMRTHLAEMEAMPFDGCVFHVNTTDEKGGHPFTWECWGKKAFTHAQLQPAIDDLKATPLHRFTNNFLRFNTTPADLDWFDDYSTIVANAKLASIVAREGKCPGILFDIEQYTNPLFNYSKQRDAKIRSFAQYAAQVRQRGRDVMEAFEEGYPNVTIFLTYGFSLPWRQCRGNAANLPQAQYGLLAPFLDGMLDAARGKSHIIDGYESSYGYKDTSRFASAHQTMSSGLLPIVADPEKYHRYFQFGFGVWMDNQWRRVGWNPQDVSKNFYSPEDFEKSVRAALDRSDEYVWIYTETPKWWTANGKPDKLPEAYIQSLRQAAGR